MKKSIKSFFQLVQKKLAPFKEKLKKNKNIYYQIGGQRTIDQLVDDFYFIMSTDPMAKECFETHQGKEIAESARKLKFFLSGWLGGPGLYLQTYGHPRLRMRHHGFTIGPLEAKQWLYCMEKALKQSPIKASIQAQMNTAFEQVAQMLIKNPA